MIKRGDVLGNSLRARQFQYDDRIGFLGRPVDRTRWRMTPQTVNAYYNASNNEIVFPAAILQPPFFDVNADDAANYGGIGAVIGHEIGHGFDDQGRKSDGSGNLRDWWTATDAQSFDARTTKLGAQYEAINPIDDLHINGKLTMGVNIGDLSGLAQAYRTYRLSLNGKSRDATMDHERRKTATAPHSPPALQAAMMSALARSRRACRMPATS